MLNFRNTAALALTVGLFATTSSAVANTEPVAVVEPTVQVAEAVTASETAQVESVVLEAVKVVPAPVEAVVEAPAPAPAPVEAVAPAPVETLAVAETVPAPVEAPVAFEEPVPVEDFSPAELGYVQALDGSWVAPEYLDGYNKHIAVPEVVVDCPWQEGDAVEAPEDQHEPWGAARDGFIMPISQIPAYEAWLDAGNTPAPGGGMPPVHDYPYLPEDVEAGLTPVEVDHGGEPNPLDGSYVPETSTEGIVKGLDPNPAP